MKNTFKKIFSLVFAIIMVITVLNVPFTSLAASVTVDKYEMTFDEDGASDFYSDENTLGKNYSIVEDNGNKVLKYTGAYNRKYALFYDIDAFNASTASGQWKKRAAFIDHSEDAVYKISFKYKAASVHGSYGTSVNLAVVGYGWQEVDKTTNDYKGIAYKNLFTAMTTCDWTEYEAFVKLDATGTVAAEGMDYGLAIGGNITGEIYFDDIKVEKYTDIPSNTVFVKTNTNLGGFAVQTTEAMPTPVKDNAKFLGWYEDEACTVAFDLTNYTEGEFVNAYAKWYDIPSYTMTFDEDGASDFYSDENTLGKNYSIVEDNGNKVLKYTGAYNRKYALFYDIDAFNASTASNQWKKRAAFIDHSEDAVYKISFKYKATSVHGSFGTSVNLAVVGYGWQEVDKTTNDYKGIAYKNLFTAKTTCDWTEYEAFVTLDATGTAAAEGMDYGLAIGGNITGEIYFDDIKVEKYTDIPSNTVFVNTDTDLGSIALQNTEAMPTPEKDNAEFVGWYEDEACTVPFDLSKYSNGEMVNAYSKWYNINKYNVTFEGDSVPHYYPGINNSTSHNTEFALATEDNNRFMRYTNNDYTERVFALYDPAKITDLNADLAAGTRDYSITASNSNTGSKVLYRVSFKYRVNSLVGGEVRFSLLTLNAQNLSGISTTTLLHTDTEITENGWQNVTTDIYVDASAANWNEKCLGLKVYGNATIDIDDIIIKDYTETEYTLVESYVDGEKIKSEIVLPADFNPDTAKNDWFTNEDCTTVFTALETRTAESAVNMVQKLYTKTTTSIKGDLNGDLAVNANDVVVLVKALLSSDNEAIYDINGDGKVDVRDLVAIKELAVSDTDEKKN